MIEERQRRYMGRGYHSIINVENHMFCRTKESNVLLKEERFQHHVTFRCENTYHIEECSSNARSGRECLWVSIHLYQRLDLISSLLRTNIWCWMVNHALMSPSKLPSGLAVVCVSHISLLYASMLPGHTLHCPRSASLHDHLLLSTLLRYFLGSHGLA